MPLTVLRAVVGNGSLGGTIAFLRRPALCPVGIILVLNGLDLGHAGILCLNELLKGVQRHDKVALAFENALVCAFSEHFIEEIKDDTALLADHLALCKPLIGCDLIPGLNIFDGSLNALHLVGIVEVQFKLLTVDFELHALFLHF